MRGFLKSCSNLMFYDLINLKIRNMLQNVRKEDYYLRLFWSYDLKWIFPSKRAEPMDYVICNAWEGKNRSLVPLGRERNSLRGMKKETFNKYLGNSTESIQAWGKGKGGVWKLFPSDKRVVMLHVWNCSRWAHIYRGGKHTWSLPPYLCGPCRQTESHS